MNSRSSFKYLDQFAQIGTKVSEGVPMHQYQSRLTDRNWIQNEEIKFRSDNF